MSFSSTFRAFENGVRSDVYLIVPSSPEAISIKAF